MYFIPNTNEFINVVVRIKLLQTNENYMLFRYFTIIISFKNKGVIVIRIFSFIHSLLRVPD